MAQTISDAYRLIHYGTLALARAERAGIRVDTNILKENKKELTRMINEKTEEFNSSSFFKKWQHTKRSAINIGSDEQLADYLYKTLGLEPAKTTASGKGSTDEMALQGLNIKALDLLLEIRKLKKMRDTYVASIERECVDGYIHPSYNLHTTLTYRSSANDPNFQNIPARDPLAKKMIRSCLFPRPGHILVEIDFGSLEVRIATCYHKDPTMIKYLKDESTNMHTDVGKQIFFYADFDLKHSGHQTLRQAAKNSFVFPQFYGDYYGNNAEGIARWIHAPTNRGWKKTDGIMMPEDITIVEHLRRNGVKSYRSFVQHLKGIEEHFWNERFPVYASWKKKWFREYEKKGYFDMFTGFRCSGIMDRNNAINYPVQGAAFHCLLYSFIEMDRWLINEKMDTRLVGQIHDSLLGDVHPNELGDFLNQAKRIMTVDLPRDWKWIIVPLEVEAEASPVDHSWYEKDKIKF